MQLEARIAFVVVTALAAVGAASASQSPLASAGKPILVRLGTHSFGHTRAPDAVVARASAAQVGWQLEGDSSGPETFLVGRDRSIWLHDEVNHRLLVWRAGRPNAVARTITLPFLNAEDVAFGPANTLYFDRAVPELKEFHLYRMSLGTGKMLWNRNLAPEAGNGNTSLRAGPDGRLYAIAGGTRWMPVATPDGRPLSIAAQRRGAGDQPLRGGLRLVTRVMGTHAPARELRVSLVDRSGKVARAWRILSRTPVAFTGFYTPDLVHGDPVVVLDVQTGLNTPRIKWEYEVLRLSATGTRTRFSLHRTVYGDNLFADVRIGADGNLYQLGSSPAAGASVSRYSLGPVGQP